MAIKSALWSIGSAIALLGLTSAPAMAGHYGPAPCAAGAQCDAGVAFVPSPTGHSGPMTVQSRTPYDFLDSVHFQRSPHVSITRIHSLNPSVGLSDAPVGFTQGCHPESTIYCRTGHPTATPPAVKPPIVPSPYVPQPVTHRPVMQQPLPTPRIVAIGGGYDPSKFTPRVYGDPYTITPGIAHLPTSIIDRDPYRAQAVLDTGQARPNPWTPGGVTPAFVGVPVRPPVPNVRPPYIHPRPPIVSGPIYQPRPPYTGPVYPRPVQPRPVYPSPVVCNQPMPAPPRVTLPHPTATPPCGAPTGYRSRY